MYASEAARRVAAAATGQDVLDRRNSADRGDRNAAAVVFDHEKLTIDHDAQLACEPCEVLVDRVRDQLEGEVLDGLAIGASEVHRRPLADAFDQGQNLDIVRRVHCQILVDLHDSSRKS
jgi:hypothetical protein